jgi:trans-aconitate methyltransferase
MQTADRAAYVTRYTDRLREHGHSPATLGWGNGGREHLRFAVMADTIQAAGARSLLDVGCGFADLHDFLRERGWTGTYQGIDVVPALLEEARRRNPDLALEEADLAEYHAAESGAFDVVVASGVFNAKLIAEDNGEHIRRSMARMFELSRLAVCVDFMTTNVDFQHPGAWHTDPAWAVELAASLSRRFLLRQDYLPFEYAVVVYRDDGHEGNLFTEL